MPVKDFRKWREEKPELYQKRLERSQKWHEENRERARRVAREGVARYRAENREEYNAYCREYAQRPEAKERARARHAAYYQKHKEQIDEQNRRWIADNIEKERIRGKNKQAWRRKATGKFTLGDIQTLYEKQNGKCAICAVIFPETGSHRFQIDHIIPLKPRGASLPVGTNNPDNLQLLCRKCNRLKWNHLPSSLGVIDLAKFRSQS